MRKIFVTAVTAMSFITAAGVSIAAIDPATGREPGDPARWFEPADTPQKQYQTAKKEADAALAEALRACRSYQIDRKECEAQARAQHEEDMERASHLLVRSNLG